MVAASSADVQPEHATRLIGFSKPCSSRLSSCLGLARVSAVAIKSDAAGSCALWDLVKKSVKPVQCEWLDEARSLQYRQTQIVSLETSVGSKKTKVSPTPLGSLANYFQMTKKNKFSKGAKVTLLAMANSYFNDQAKLADARALARSFSQTKPPKTKGNSRPRAHTQDRDAQLRGAAGAQLTQSIVRMYLGPFIIQLAVAPRAELPPTSSLTGQSQSLANAEAPTSGVAGSVLDEFLSLMSQQEKELAKVDPLIDQLQQWHLQSPAEAKSNTVAMPRLASLESSKPAFSVNLQIVIHQDFCPMSERHKSAQQALRAQAEPFTPRF
ncbi:hypothetical protein MY5147_002178 [Beauveria neobassiana]